MKKNELKEVAIAVGGTYVGAKVASKIEFNDNEKLMLARAKLTISKNVATSSYALHDDHSDNKRHMLVEVTPNGDNSIGLTVSIKSGNGKAYTILTTNLYLGALNVLHKKLMDLKRAIDSVVGIETV
jgi:hypothetical protein